MNRCFADREKECSALKLKQCERHFDWKSKKYKYYDCEFYKTQEQHKADVEEATKRIKSLDTCNSIVSFYKLDDI